MARLVLSDKLKFVFLSWSLSIISALPALAQPYVPNSGAYVGVSLGGQMSLGAFNDATGVMHSMNVQFFKFPEVVQDQFLRAELHSFIEESLALNAVPVLTLETFDGLSSYTEAQIDELAVLLGAYEQGIVVRWNHEMNGPWYPWGQQPDLYREKFRQFAYRMREFAPNVAMAWTPNHGEGYPWGGSLVGGEDPYEGYYPGDDVVDWVGFSYYHWGRDEQGLNPGQNRIPPEQRWDTILGTESDGFYQRYGVERGKPLMIAETSALYRPSTGGEDEYPIKAEWINQVYRLDLYPMVKAINWFNVVKFESEVKDQVSWSILNNAELTGHYVQALSDPRWYKASDNVSIRNRPAQPLIRGTATTYHLDYVASGERDVEISLYFAPEDTRETVPWTWIAGAETSVGPGRGMVALTVRVPQSAPKGSGYIVETRISPSGGEWSTRYYYDQFVTSVEDYSVP